MDYPAMHLQPLSLYFTVAEIRVQIKINAMILIGETE